MGLQRTERRRRRILLMNSTSQFAPSVDKRQTSPEIETDPVDTAAFHASCGGSAPIRLTLRDLRSGHSTCHLFESPTLIVGRHPRADLFIDDARIETRHGLLQLIDGALHWFRLSDQSPDACVLPFGGAISIGPYQLELADDEFADVTTRSASSAAPPQVVLRFENSSRNNSQDRCFEVSRRVTLLGRSRGTHVRLDDSSVSPAHCAIVTTPDGVWLVDLLTSSGTRVNNVSARLLPINDGDLLSIGQFRMRVAVTPRSVQRPTETREPAANTNDLSIAAVTKLIEQFAAMQRENDLQIRRLLSSALAMLEQPGPSAAPPSEQLDLLAREIEQLAARLKTASRADNSSAAQQHDSTPDRRRMIDDLRGELDRLTERRDDDRRHVSKLLDPNSSATESDPLD